jgi:radical SAM superfamily enzyme YgiQ (UPF0313 family)
MKTGKNRVLLINCNEIKSNDRYPVVAPIGLFFINGYLTAQGYETKILQLITVAENKPKIDEAEYRNEMKQAIEDFNPDWIGISFRNLEHIGLPRKKQPIDFFSISQDKKAVEFLREITDVKIIGGGSAFSMQPVLYMKYLNLDFGIVGEGEIAFEKLIRCLDTNQEWKDIPGLVYWQDHELAINPNQFIVDLDQMPMMKIDASLDYKGLYHDRGEGYCVNIQTKRGCGFQCIYCIYPFLEGHEYRLRDVKKILNEVLYIKHNYGIRKFFIVDSVFSTPVEHSLAFCRELIKNKADIKWAAYINPRGITREVLDIYKEAGCEYLNLTPDALSDQALQGYRKGFSVEDVKNCIQLLKESEIPFAVDCILGGPGEDEQTINETLEFCSKYLRDEKVYFAAGMILFSNIPEIGYSQPEELLLRNTCNNRNNRLDHFIDLSTVLLDNKKPNPGFDNFAYFLPQITQNREVTIFNIFLKIFQSQPNLLVEYQANIWDLIRQLRVPQWLVVLIKIYYGLQCAVKMLRKKSLV